MKISRRNFLAAMSSFALSARLLKADEQTPYIFTRPKLKTKEPLQNFCFGSCNREHKVQPCWGPIQELSPEFFMWLGDSIYADTRDMNVMKKKFDQQLQDPGYKKLIQKTPVIGTWDDHDYGENDAGTEYVMKEESRQLYLDFLNESKNSLRRTRQGLYTSYNFGPQNKKVKLILLDIRFNKTKEDDAHADLLGEEQWRWLEDELANSDAQFHFIASSISVLSSTQFFTEDWIKYPKSYDRLFDILDRYNPTGTLFLAGDKHFGCFSTRPTGHQGHRYYEMLSSGLTHTVPGFYKPIVRRYYGAHKTFTDINFGQIRIDWNNHDLICDIRGRLGQLALRRIYKKDPKTGRLYEHSYFKNF